MKDIFINPVSHPISEYHLLNIFSQLIFSYWSPNFFYCLLHLPFDPSYFIAPIMSYYLFYSVYIFFNFFLSSAHLNALSHIKATDNVNSISRILILCSRNSDGCQTVAEYKRERQNVYNQNAIVNSK